MTTSFPGQPVPPPPPPEGAPLSAVEIPLFPSNISLEPFPGPAGRRTWGGWGTLAFGFAIFTVYTTVQAVIAAFFVVPALLNNRNPSMDEIMKLATNGLMLSIATILSGLAGIAVTLVFIRLRRGASVSEYLGLGRISWRVVLASVGVAVGLQLFADLLGRLAPTTQPAEPFMFDVYRTSVWPWLFWVSVAVFAPAFEEIFFRGFLLTGFQQSRLGTAGAVIITSLAWASLHIQYTLPTIIIILIMGIILGIIRLKTGSLWGPLFIHAAWNLIALAQVAYGVNSMFG